MRTSRRRCWLRFALISSTGWRCRGRAWSLCVLPRRSESATRVAAFYLVLPRQWSLYFRITSLYIFFSRWEKATVFPDGLPHGRQTFFSPELVSTCYTFAPQIANRPALISSPRGV